MTFPLGTDWCVGYRCIQKQAISTLPRNLVLWGLNFIPWTHCPVCMFSIFWSMSNKLQLFVLSACWQSSTLSTHSIEHCHVSLPFCQQVPFAFLTPIRNTLAARQQSTDLVCSTMRDFSPDNSKCIVCWCRSNRGSNSKWLPSYPGRPLPLWWN